MKVSRVKDYAENIKFLATTKKFAKNHKKITAIIVVILLGVLFGIFRLTQPTETTIGENIAEAEVIKGPIEVTVTGTGTIVPVGSEEIGPNASGTVKKIYVQNGDKVKKGDIIVDITNDSLNLQLENARLELEKAALDLGGSSGGGIMTAPFAGRIVSLDVKTGDDVTKNTGLATLQDDSQLVFDMPINSAAANKVSVNQKVEVFLPDRGETVAGRVISKSNQPVSGYNGENRVYLKVALSATGNLSPGINAFGTLTIEGKQVDALAVSSLEWAEQTQLKAAIAGKVTGVYVREGQPVKKGQKLFAFDSSEQKAQELAYRQAELNAADLESQVADLTVKAPIDGVVSGMDIEVGDEIGDGSTSVSGTKAGQSTGSSDSTATASAKSLGKIINSGQMEISFPVDEVEIAKVKIGQLANVTADALPDQIFNGKVTEIAEEGTVTNNVSSFDVTILLNNPEGLLKSGMTTNVTIVVAKKDDAVLIPIEALQERGQRKFVLIPSSGASDQARNMQPVTVGLTNESFAEILEGLQVGDKVLLPGQQANASRPNSMMPGFGGGGSRNPVGGGTRNLGGGSSGTFRVRN